jgi:xylulokinase
MTSSYFIGIDVGTSGAKAVVMERGGGVFGFAARAYVFASPKPGWAEQDPADWEQAAAACVTEALRSAGVLPAQVMALGLAGQMHSLVCLDAAGAPVRPAILWADNRSADQVRALEAHIGRAQLAEWVGNPIAAGFPPATWAWLQAHEPETIRRTQTLLQPKDYLRLRWTGQAATDLSDASATGLFDPRRLEWSAPMLAALGLAPGLLPPVLPSGQAAGGLLREAAAALGLPEGLPVAVGASDVSAQALAQGVTTPGQVSCTIGTGGQLFAPLAAPLHDPSLGLHLFCHCLPQVWHQEAAILTAGLALRWLRDRIFTGQDYAALADAAQAACAAEEGLFFLPFLAGERTPYMNADLRAGFLGLGLGHTQAAMTRAVMEGVVFALRQGLERMQALGAPVERLLASGGGTRHPLWLQLQADIFGRPIFLAGQPGGIEAEYATARGAAMLAGVAAGAWSSASEAARSAAPEPRPAAWPDPQRVERYAAAYQAYARWADMLAAAISRPLYAPNP